MSVLWIMNRPPDVEGSLGEPATAKGGWSPAPECRGSDGAAGCHTPVVISFDAERVTALLVEALDAAGA